MSAPAYGVLRRVSEHDEAGWLDKLAPDRLTDPIGHLAITTAHPNWVAQAFAVALADCAICDNFRKWPPGVSGRRAPAQAGR